MPRIEIDRNNCDYGSWDVNGQPGNLIDMVEHYTGESTDNIDFNYTFVPDNPDDVGKHNVPGKVLIEYTPKNPPWILGALPLEGHRLGRLMSDSSVPFSPGATGKIQEAGKALGVALFKEVAGYKNANVQKVHDRTSKVIPGFSSEANIRRLQEAKTARTVESILFDGHLKGLKQLQNERGLDVLQWMLNGTDDVRNDSRGARDWAVRIQTAFSTMPDPLQDSAEELIQSHAAGPIISARMKDQSPIVVPFRDDELIFFFFFMVAGDSTVDVYSTSRIQPLERWYTNFIAETTRDRLSRALDNRT